MSHKTKITNIAFTEEKAIRETAEILRKQGVNVELKENSTLRYYNTSDKATYPFVFNLKDCEYDVGLERNEKTGAYNPVYDSFRGNVATCLGVKEANNNSQEKNIGLLQQAYAYAVARNQARQISTQRGFFMQETVASNGTMRITLTER
jgi:hypothetical protein